MSSCPASAMKSISRRPTSGEPPSLASWRTSLPRSDRASARPRRSSVCTAVCSPLQITRTRCRLAAERLPVEAASGRPGGAPRSVCGCRSARAGADEAGRGTPRSHCLPWTALHPLARSPTEAAPVREITHHSSQEQHRILVEEPTIDALYLKSRYGDSNPSFWIEKLPEGLRLVAAVLVFGSLEPYPANRESD